MSEEKSKDSIDYDRACKAINKVREEYGMPGSPSTEFILQAIILGKLISIDNWLSNIYYELENK